MTPDEIKAKLGIDDATVRLSDNEAFYWVSVSREHQGQRYSHNWRLPLEPYPSRIEYLAGEINQWWANNTATVVLRAPMRPADTEDHD